MAATDPIDSKALERRVHLKGLVAADVGPTVVESDLVGDGIAVSVVANSATNQSVNLAQVAGTTTSVGNGVVGNGTQRVTQAQPATALLLSAVTTGGLGGVVDLGQNYSKVGMQVTASDGSATTTDLLCLLGSLDGGEFFIIAQSAAGIATEFNTVGSSGANARGYVSSIPCRYIRAGIGTVADGHFTATATAVGGTATITAQAVAIP